MTRVTIRSIQGGTEGPGEMIIMVTHPISQKTSFQNGSPRRHLSHILISKNNDHELQQQEVQVLYIFNNGNVTWVFHFKESHKEWKENQSRTKYVCF